MVVTKLTGSNLSLTHTHTHMPETNLSEVVFKEGKREKEIERCELKREREMREREG